MTEASGYYSTSRAKQGENVFSLLSYKTKPLELLLLSLSIMSIGVQTSVWTLLDVI